MYNRRQRNLWLDRQLEELQKARLAYANGTATSEQLDILRNEKIGEIEKQKKEEAKEQRLWNRTKKYLFQETAAQEAPAMDLTPDKPSLLESPPLNVKRMESPSLSTESNSTTSTLQPGPLGHASQRNVTDAATKPSGRSWKSWITGQ